MRSIFRQACAEQAPARRLVALGLFALGALSGLAQSPATAAREPVTHRVAIEAMAFSPSTVKVRPGDRIEFENRDLVPHTATAKGPGGFDSGVIQKGATWGVTLGKAGSLRYVCLLHPTMSGSIVVEK